MKSRISLDERVAVVTGGSTGIGRAIAELFARCGATVVTWDLQPAAEAPTGVQAQYQVDVADGDSIAAAARATVAAHGEIQLLVNNAGYGGPIAPIHDYPLDEWDRIMRVNLDGVMLCCRAVLPAMRAARYGRIVNIASLAGKEGTPNAGPYSVSKAGVIAMTKALGKENAAHGIFVNAIAPAAVQTEMLDQFTDEHVRIMIEKSPLGRLGTVEEVAALTAWLACDDCSFSTGAVHDLSGGRATY